MCEIKGFHQSIGCIWWRVSHVIQSPHEQSPRENPHEWVFLLYSSLKEKVAKDTAIFLVTYVSSLNSFSTGNTPAFLHLSHFFFSFSFSTLTDFPTWLDFSGFICLFSSEKNTEYLLLLLLQLVFL